jgi:hypothetical protein
MSFWRKNLRLQYSKLAHTTLRIPRLVIRVRAPRQELLSTDVPAVLDTGSDRTCIPASVFTKLGELNFEYGEVGVQGALGAVEKRKTFIVHLKFAECDFHDLEVIALDEEFALIGRDLLNRHKIVLDGPKLEFEIKKFC